MISKNLSFLILIAVAIVSCNNREVELSIQNASLKDSLNIKVATNGNVIFDEVVPKAITNTSAMRRKFSLVNDSLVVDVEIPSIGKKQSAVNTREDVNTVVITIRSVFDTLLLRNGKIPQREEISIAFFNELEKKTRGD